MRSTPDVPAGDRREFEKFRKRIDRLHEVVTSLKRYYAVWLELYEFGSKRAQLWKFYLGFFATVQLALGRMVLMELAKAFDKDRRSAGLRALIQLAKQNPSLTPRWSAADVNRCCETVSRCANEVDGKVKEVRNKELAHADAEPPDSRIFQQVELDRWIRVLENGLNDISWAHDGRSFWYEPIVGETTRHTRSLLEGLSRGAAIDNARQGETYE